MDIMKFNAVLPIVIKLPEGISIYEANNMRVFKNPVDEKMYLYLFYSEYAQQRTVQIPEYLVSSDQMADFIKFTEYVLKEALEFKAQVLKGTNLD